MMRRLFIGLVALAACRAADRSATPKEAAAAPAAPVQHTFTITARDFAYDAPDTIPAGYTTFRFVNAGPNFHHAQFFRIDSGHTAAELQALMATPGTPPRWVVPVGGPNAPTPGDSGTTIVQMTPGNYVLLCLVDTPDHVPHFAKGMFHPITVTPSDDQGSAPTPDVVLTTQDYSFAFDKPLTAGHHLIEVRNTAQQPHEVELVRLAPGKKIGDILTWMYKPAGTPPAEGLGGTAAFTGQPVYFDANLTPGTYGLICFVPDAKDGKPHFMHGMQQEIKVE